jgi:predicted dehydrogenase
MEEGLSKIDGVLISNPSSEHAYPLEQVIKKNIPCYIEKPIVSTLKDLLKIKQLSASFPYTATSMVGCNLRYLPSLKKVKEIISQKKLGNIVRVCIEAGQWLPDWRPDQDYRKVYSARKELGGGVILDLIHEIDLIVWLFDEFQDYKVYNKHCSNLQINSDDVACILLNYNNGPLVSMNLDYVSRFPTRIYKFIGEEGTLIWDLFLKKLLLIKKDQTDILSDNKLDFDVPYTYTYAMNEFLTAVDKGSQTSQNLHEGIRITELALKILEGVPL